MNKNTIIGAIVLLAAIIGGYFLLNKQPATNEPIKIGFIGPLTGDASQWGVPPKEGVEIALEKLGGMINNKKVEIIYEDSRCNSSIGVSAIQKLINIDKVSAVIGAVCSSVTLAIAPVAENADVVLISPASTNPKITDAGNYIFRVVPSDYLRGKLFAEYVKNDVDLNKIAILYINNEAGVGNKESFKNEFEALGGVVTSVESYEQGTRDVRTQLLKIKKQNPQAIVIVSYPADSVVVLKQIKDLGLKLPLYFQTEAIEDPSVIEGAGEAINGVVYILPAEPSGEKVNDFKNTFEKKFNKSPELYAAEGFDAFNLLAKAIKDCNGKNNLSLCIKDKLYATEDYHGASGIISFDKNGDVLKPMAIKKIINGERITIKVIK